MKKLIKNRIEKNNILVIYFLSEIIKGMQKKGVNVMKSKTVDKMIVATMVAVGLFQISVVGLALWLVIKLIKYFG